jgi:hypothetical protein
MRSSQVNHVGRRAAERAEVGEAGERDESGMYEIGVSTHYKKTSPHFFENIGYSLE